MRLLLLGNQSPIGWEVERTLSPLGDVVAYDFPSVDLSKACMLRDLVLEEKPDVIINTIADEDIDQPESGVDQARLINADAPGVLAEAARKLNAGLIHFSTADVFDGTKQRAYCEEDTPNPINQNGQTRLDGERAVAQVGGAYLIFRTSWVYSTRHECFVTEVLQRSREQTILQAPNDQVGSPTWARMLAEVTAQVLAMGGEDAYSWLTECAGLYHLGGSGSASRLEWAQAIVESDPKREEQIISVVQSGLTSDFPTSGKRPLNTALDCSWFIDRFGLNLPNWKKALHLALAS